MKEIEDKLKKFLEARGWTDLVPANLAKSIMIEGAELLELFQWQNLSLVEVKAQKKKLKAIQEEIADVLIYAIQLSILLEFDTKNIIFQKLKKADKKYPAHLMRKNKKDDSGSEDIYWKIKMAHRAKKSK